MAMIKCLDLEKEKEKQKAQGKGKMIGANLFEWSKHLESVITFRIDNRTLDG